MPSMQSSVREHLPGRHCLLPQTSLLLLPQRGSEKEREKKHTPAQEQVSERADLFMFSQAARQKVLLFFSFFFRQTVCFLFQHRHVHHSDTRDADNLCKAGCCGRDMGVVGQREVERVTETHRCFGASGGGWCSFTLELKFNFFFFFFFFWWWGRS